MQASVALPSDSNGLYVIWENLLGMPLTFTNLQLTTVDGNGIAAAGVPVEFPAATVHMSAAVVCAGDHAIVDTATIAFTAKGTTPHGAKPTAVMALSTDDMAPERLGCTFGFYFGWFKSNVAGRDVCKGADFGVEIVGDVLTLTGTIKSIPPDMAGAELAGDIQVAPAAAFFQGDNHYTFSATPHGTEGFRDLHEPAAGARERPRRRHRHRRAACHVHPCLPWVQDRQVPRDRCRGPPESRGHGLSKVERVPVKLQCDKL